MAELRHWNIGNLRLFVVIWILAARSICCVCPNQHLRRAILNRSFCIISVIAAVVPCIIGNCLQFCIYQAASILVFYIASNLNNTL